MKTHRYKLYAFSIGILAFLILLNSCIPGPDPFFFVYRVTFKNNSSFPVNFHLYWWNKDIQLLPGTEETYPPQEALTVITKTTYDFMYIIDKEEVRCTGEIFDHDHLTFIINGPGQDGYEVITTVMD